ncbi:hypothetical protein ACFLT8_04135 [Chloroflexota bacterium]
MKAAIKEVRAKITRLIGAGEGEELSLLAEALKLKLYPKGSSFGKRRQGEPYHYYLR